MAAGPNSYGNLVNTFLHEVNCPITRTLVSYFYINTPFSCWQNLCNASANAMNKSEETPLFLKLLSRD